METTTRRGLTSQEAVRRLAEEGPNEIPAPPPAGIVRGIVEQLRDPTLIVLLLAALLTTITGDHPDTIVILLVVLLNTTVGIVQHRRAERAVAALRDLAPLRCTVLRDGRPRSVPAREIVPGDLVSLGGGDIVCADGTLQVAEALTLDESAMTGESVPVLHGPGDQLSGGTLVVRGRGELAISATGANSGLGRLASLVHEATMRPTPLQDRMRRLSVTLVVSVLALTVLVVVLGLLRGEGLVEMLVVGASLAVAAVPESLPAVMTVALATGAHRMARRSAVVRRLSAVETLGSVSVIATDKTGTLTHGSLRVEHLWPGRGSRDPETLLRDLALCNDASLGTGGRPAAGDPLEVALLDRALQEGLDPESVRESWVRTGEVPFDARSQTMVTVHRSGRDLLTVAKGAPERILPLVAAGDRDEATALADRWARDGCRVLAVGHAARADLAPTSLDLVGLVAFADPPRTAAADVVARCREAGIRVVLVTGDHAQTARSIARQVGIPDDLALDPGHPSGASVFARVTPEQKLQLVDGLQASGEVVAMLGDGVNDAPALRRADIGVAAGRGGTEVARQAADLVLLDDDLSTVASAVEEGRRIFANLRAFLVYAVSGGVSEVAVMLLGPFVGLPLPLLPSQILWVNLLTHGLTGVAFSAEPADPAAMRAPPVPRSAPVLTRRHVVLLLSAAAALTVSSLGTALLVGGALGRTAAFLTLGLGQLGVAFALRGRGVLTPSGRALSMAIASSAALMLLPLYLAPLQELLDVRLLDRGLLLLCGAAALLPGLFVVLLRRLIRTGRREPRPPTTAPEVR